MRAQRDYFDEGIELFNAGKFFECHEAWEEIWKRSHGQEKLFLQGMIQAAVAILHAQRGNFEGAASLCGKAKAKLEGLPRDYRTLRLGEFRDLLREFFEVALTRKVAPAPPLIRRIDPGDRKGEI